jgi:hypothetical protein
MPFNSGDECLENKSLIVKKAGFGARGAIPDFFKHSL